MTIDRRREREARPQRLIHKVKLKEGEKRGPSEIDSGAPLVGVCLNSECKVLIRCKLEESESANVMKERVNNKLQSERNRFTQLNTKLLLYYTLQLGVCV